MLSPTVKPASEVSVVRRPQVDCNPPQQEKLRRGQGAGRSHSFFGEECGSLECGSLLPLFPEPACWRGFSSESTFRQTNSAERKAAACCCFLKASHSRADGPSRILARASTGGLLVGR